MFSAYMNLRVNLEDPDCKNRSLLLPFEARNRCKLAANLGPARNSFKHARRDYKHPCSACSTKQDDCRSSRKGDLTLPGTLWTLHSDAG